MSERHEREAARRWTLWAVPIVLPTSLYALFAGLESLFGVSAWMYSTYLF